MASRHEKISSFFQSESTWPFLLRKEELAQCIDFLSEKNSHIPKILRIFGASGTGKSFFTRELVTQLSRTNRYHAVLYIDIPLAGFEASGLAGKVDWIISRHRKSSRATPQFVSKSLARRWRRKKLALKPWMHYVYHIFRDLTLSIEGIGNIIYAFLPDSLIKVKKNDGSFRFLIEASERKPILIVLDNVQFLQQILLEILDLEFMVSGKYFQLVIVERTTSETPLNWLPNIPNAFIKDITFGTVGMDDIQKILKTILPNDRNSIELAKTIFRRSEGNLKSVWFQLKFIVERRTEQGVTDQPESYEKVVLSLSPIDQSVLRMIAFLLGGLTIAHIVKIFEMSNMHIGSESIAGSIADLATIGLVVINSENHDRVRVEHEIVTQVIESTTPEDEKLEMRQQLVFALCSALENNGNAKDDVLHDRLIGLITEEEFRSMPSLQNRIVNFLHDQNQKECFVYLAELFRNSVCWDVLDLLPAYIVRSLLNALQKCSLFNFGLLTTEKLKRNSTHFSLAKLYEAKYLIQLFRYDEAEQALKDVEPSQEKNAVFFNIMLNKCQDKKARGIAKKTYEHLSYEDISEHVFLILRNAGHLFDCEMSKKMLRASLEGFRQIGSEFGVATALNNLGIVYAVCDDLNTAKKHFLESRDMLNRMYSNEVYQPLVNISAVFVREGKFVPAIKYLDEAQKVVPRLLAMDAIMIQYNKMVIRLLDKDIEPRDFHSELDNLHAQALKTKDLRFITVLAWFLSNMKAQLGKEDNLQYSKELIKSIFDSGTAPIEFFIPYETNQIKLTVPYILSPHWRY